MGIQSLKSIIKIHKSTTAPMDATAAHSNLNEQTSEALCGCWATY
jgi:hypothetical protein